MKTTIKEISGNIATCKLPLIGEVKIIIPNEVILVVGDNIEISILSSTTAGKELIRWKFIRKY